MTGGRGADLDRSRDRDRVARPSPSGWDVHHSLALSLAALTGLTLVAWATARSVVGSKTGYYLIAGLHWRHFVYAHWVGATAAWSLFLRIDAVSLVRGRRRQYLHRALALAALSVAFYGLVVLIPGGGRALAV
jgi:hypothetical protein